MRHEAQLIRLVLICAAWALGQTLTFGLAAGSAAELIVPAALAVGVYAITEDLGRPHLSRGDVKYWRGRPVDDERGARRVDDERRGGRLN